MGEEEDDAKAAEEVAAEDMEEPAATANQVDQGCPQRLRRPKAKKNYSENPEGSAARSSKNATNLIDKCRRVMKCPRAHSYRISI